MGRKGDSKRKSKKITPVSKGDVSAASSSHFSEPLVSSGLKDNSAAERGNSSANKKRSKGK